MAIDSNLKFIREKIYKVRSAIMYTMSNEVVKMPNNIVTAIKVDEGGYLWILSKRPIQFVSECEQVFPARLKFYRKGVSFSVEVSGKATIMNSGYSIEQGTDEANRSATDPVLLKINMSNIEYCELEEKRKSRMELLLEQGYKWVLRTVAFPRHPKPFLAKLHQRSI